LSESNRKPFIGISELEQSVSSSILLSTVSSVLKHTANLIYFIHRLLKRSLKKLVRKWNGDIIEILKRHEDKIISKEMDVGPNVQSYKKSRLTSSPGTQPRAQSCRL
jgi:hypothetical protein